MLIAIFGESCVGKSTLAEKLNERLGTKIYSGRDYERLAKNEADARKLFETILQNSVREGAAIWVITEKEDMTMLPAGAVRVLVTADLAVIKERFAARMQGQLPVPVAAMLEKKHGCFDAEAHDFHITAADTDIDSLYAHICGIAKTKK